MPSKKKAKQIQWDKKVAVNRDNFSQLEESERFFFPRYTFSTFDRLENKFRRETRTEKQQDGQSHLLDCRTDNTVVDVFRFGHPDVGIPWTDWKGKCKSANFPHFLFSPSEYLLL